MSAAPSARRRAHRLRNGRLRNGFTTGAAAAAATRAALELLISGRVPDSVTVPFLTAGQVTVAVHAHGCEPGARGDAWCSVIKDAGDDPDVTHRAEIGARVRWLSPREAGDDPVRIIGGRGVGRVTKPGLEVPAGQAAINPGPRRMIRQAVRDVLAGHRRQAGVEVAVFVPEGRALAAKTLNARLGIVGGISILGTTGIERPMSHEAYIASIRAALSVARAAGLGEVVLTTGRRSERFARRRRRRLPPEAFVQMGDFFRAAVQAAAARGFERIGLAVFFGKAVKMAQGIGHTHAARAEFTLARLARWARRIEGDADLAAAIAAANTARHAFDLIWPGCPALVEEVVRRIGRVAAGFAERPVAVEVLLFDFDGNLIAAREWEHVGENAHGRGGPAARDRGAAAGGTHP